MLGIDEIGIQIEQPFGALPLHGLATLLTLDVADELLLTHEASDLFNPDVPSLEQTLPRGVPPSSVALP
eukprot:scaffold36132_cov34-Tisochrysis_lutea.AAC.5